jgi:hypothetical protein
MADEGGVSFWIPGFFGSLAAVPQQPGWSLANIFYNTNVKAGGDVALAREFEIGNVPLHFSGSASASVKADVPLGQVIPQYVFATPVLGGQATVGVIGTYGRNDTTLAGTLNGTISLGPVSSPIMKSINLTDTTWGFADVIPLASLRWNQGVNNWMIYGTGDIPVGAYQSTRLANLGIGHGTVDVGVGYTYFNHPASAGCTVGQGRCSHAAPERRLGLVKVSATPPLGPCDGAAPVYSITSSARSRIDGGIARPSAVAVLRFTTISNLVGNCTGRSPGFSPRRMRSA